MMKTKSRVIAACLFLPTLSNRLLLFASQELLVASPLVVLASTSAASPVPVPIAPSSACPDDNVHGDITSDTEVTLSLVDVAPRGGAAFDDHSYFGVDTTTRDAILLFLRKTSSSNSSNNNKHAVVIYDTFHVQGWRWHFMSLIRDSKRLERLSTHLTSILTTGGADTELETAGLDALHHATNYVVNFNMASLFRIQSGIFTTFLRKHLCDKDSLRKIIVGDHERDVTSEINAFGKVIDTIDDYRVRSEKIGSELNQRAKALVSFKSLQQQQQGLGDIIRLTKQLSDHLSSMRQLQETLVVPAVARVVSPKVQRSFNYRVLLNLGIFESRVHLVGMRDAIWESGLESEKKAFESEIPSNPRKMIERWRQSLYIPKAGSLDFGIQ